jgi:hypothetical protein
VAVSKQEFHLFPRKQDNNNPDRKADTESLLTNLWSIKQQRNSVVRELCTKHHALCSILILSVVMFIIF